MTFDPKKFFKPTDVAAATGIAIQTLAKWRCLGTGPSYHKLGGLCFYQGSDINAWLEDGRVVPAGNGHRIVVSDTLYRGGTTLQTSEYHCDCNCDCNHTH